MDIRKRLWNWCPRPKKPASTSFTRLALPLYVSLLIGGLLLTVGVAMVLLPPMIFNSSFDESGRVTEVVERVLFPGGAIVVYKHPIYDSDPAWSLSIKVHNYITCEEDLLVYVNSRTTALNELLSSLSPDDKIWVTVTFKESLEPADFKNLYEHYLAQSDRLDQSAIIVENEASGELETITLNAPSPDYLEEFITYPKKGLKTMGVISFDALVKADVAKTLKQDARILLVDPQECLTIRGLVKKYSQMGFKVTVDRPPILVKVFEPESTWGSTTIEELLTNPSKYNRWRLYFIGKISDLSFFEDAPFKLDEKLLVCYKYCGIDLSEQIAAEDIKNGDYAIVIGTFFKEHSTLYADKIEKVKQDYPLALTVDELHANSAKYDGQTVQVFGRVSDLGYLEEPFFKLDGKLLICYIHNNTNLQSQLNGVQNGDPMIVTGMFRYDGMTLYAEHIRPSKDIRQ